MRGLGLSHTTYSSFLESGGFRELNHGFLEFTRTLMSSPSSSLTHQNPPPPKSIASFPPKGLDVSLSQESCAFHLGPLSAESPVFLLEHFVLFPALKCTYGHLPVYCLTSGNIAGLSSTPQTKPQERGFLKLAALIADTIHWMFPGSVSLELGILSGLGGTPTVVPTVGRKIIEDRVLSV